MQLRADPIWFYVGDGTYAEEMLCVRPHAVHVRGEPAPVRQLEAAALYRGLARLLRAPAGQGERWPGQDDSGVPWFESHDYYLVVTEQGVYVQRRLLVRPDDFARSLHWRLCKLMLQGMISARLPRIWQAADRERHMAELPGVLKRIDTFLEESEVDDGK